MPEGAIDMENCEMSWLSLQKIVIDSTDKTSVVKVRLRVDHQAFMILRFHLF